MLGNAGRVSVLPSSFQKNVALLRSIWRWRCQAASHRCETPLLDVGFDEDEAGLAKVDVDGAGTIGSDGREEVLGLETMDDILQFLSVASEEDCARARAIANTYDIALHVLGTVLCTVKRLVVATLASRSVCSGVFVEAREPEQRVRLRGHADAEQCVFRLVVDLCLPVVNLVLFGHRQVTEHSAFGVEELDLGAALDEAVGDFKLGLEFPGGDTLFLDSKVLGERDIGLERLGRISSHESLGSQVFCALIFLHGLEGLCLLAGECLLVIVFAGAADAVKEDATATCVAEEVDDEEDDGDKEGGAKRGQETDNDAVEGGKGIRCRHVVGRCVEGSGVGSWSSLKEPGVVEEDWCRRRLASSKEGGDVDALAGWTGSRGTTGVTAANAAFAGGRRLRMLKYGKLGGGRRAVR